MNDIIDLILGSDDTTVWMLQIFAVVFATLLANFMAGRVIKRVAKRAESTNNPWDDALVRALRRPVRLMIWVVGLTFALEVAYIETDAPIFAVVYPIRDVGVIFSIVWFALRFIKAAEKNILHDSVKSEMQIDHTTVVAIAKILRLTVAITGMLIAMQTLGFSIGGVVAFGGIGGMAIGFAAKDLLANFFGALMIYFDRPFSVGDWICSPDKEIEGTVEEIGWRLTRIRTFDKRPLYIPNSVFATIAVQNPSRMTHRRIYETIGVRYDDMNKVNDITKDVEKMLKEHEEIDDSQTLMVHLNNFSASSVDFFIYTFTHTTNWQKFHEIKQDVLLKISNIIEKHGAEIAYPTSTIHIPSGLGSSPEFAGLETKNA